MSSSDQYYPYKALLDVLLNYSEDAKESQLQSQLYYKDSAFFMDNTDPILGGNFGLTERFVATKDGGSIYLEGPLYTDVLQQQSLLLNNVPVRIKLTPVSSEIALMHGTSENYRVIVEDAYLWVCHAELNSETYNSIAKDFDKHTAKYLYMKS